MTDSLRRWYDRTQWRSAYQANELPALGMAAACVSGAAIAAARRKLVVPSLAVALLSTPLYGTTYYKLSTEASDALKYEPAILASALLFAGNFHRAVSTTKVVPSVTVLVALGAGAYYVRYWRYTRGYLGRDWRGYLGTNSN